MRTATGRPSATPGVNTNWRAASTAAWSNAWPSSPPADLATWTDVTLPVSSTSSVSTTSAWRRVAMEAGAAASTKCSRRGGVNAGAASAADTREGTANSSAAKDTAASPLRRIRKRLLRSTRLARATLLERSHSDCRSQGQAPAFAPHTWKTPTRRRHESALLPPERSHVYGDLPAPRAAGPRAGGRGGARRRAHGPHSGLAGLLAYGLLPNPRRVAAGRGRLRGELPGEHPR